MRTTPLAVASAGLLLSLVGCTPGGNLDAGTLEPEDAGVENCEYPEGAVEPMALDGVLSPYSWPEALDADRTNFAIDLDDVACTTDDAIDWSPFDVLLFVSIPAW